MRFIVLLLIAASACHASPMAKGADVGWLQQMEESGFIFRDKQGRPADCLQILKDHGMNTIRLRVWVESPQHPKSHHCGKEKVTAMAKRAAAMGFRILIDFHYSHTWADPSHQTKPPEWADLDFPQLKQEVFDHTADVLKTLKANGVTPEWVQVGNEIRNGMLWPDGSIKQPENLAALINEGYRAVKETDPRIQVIVHLHGGEENAPFRRFFDLMREHGARFDIIGLSYYPAWKKNPQNYLEAADALAHNLNDMVARYQKPVMLVEIGGESTRPADTKALLEATLRHMRAIPNQQGLGVLYWEPQGAAIWSKYKLSCWNDDGTPTEALEAFQENP